MDHNELFYEKLELNYRPYDTEYDFWDDYTTHDYDDDDEEEDE